MTIRTRPASNEYRSGLDRIRWGSPKRAEVDRILLRAEEALLAGLKVQVDPALPEGTAELREADGTVHRIVNLWTEPTDG